VFDEETCVVDKVRHPHPSSCLGGASSVERLSV
jgi:hypothetical protein